MPTPPDTQAPAAPPLFSDRSPVNPHSSAQLTTRDGTGESGLAEILAFPPVHLVH